MGYRNENGTPTVTTKAFYGLNHMAKGREGELSQCENVSSDEFPCLSVSKGFETVVTDLGRVLAIHSLDGGITGVIDTGDGVFVFYKGKKYEYSAGGKRIEADSGIHIYSMSGGLFIHEVTVRGTETLYKLMPEAPEEEDRVVRQCYIENSDTQVFINGAGMKYCSSNEFRSTIGTVLLAFKRGDVDNPISLDFGEFQYENTVPENLTGKRFFVVLGPEGEEDKFLLYREKESDFNDWCKENEKDANDVPAYMVGVWGTGDDRITVTSGDFTIPWRDGAKTYKEESKYEGFRVVTFVNREKKALRESFVDNEDVWYEATMILENVMPEVTPMEVHCGRLWCARLDGTSILASSDTGEGDEFFYFSGTAAASVYINSNLPGAFTGVKSYNDSLIAFKEDSMTVIYGDTAANFSVGKEIRGVGCIDIDSAQVVDGILYFYSPSGFYSYGGGQPRRISEKLKVNFKKVKAFSSEGKYYAEGTDAEGNSELLVYDTEKGIWLSEKPRGITSSCLTKGEVYIAASGEVLRRKRITEESENQEWFFESMELCEGAFEKKGINEIYVKAKLKKGAEMSVRVLLGEEERGQGDFIGTGKIEVYRVPVKLKKDDSYKIRVSGTGEALIYEMERQVYAGGRNIGEGDW